MVHACVQLLLFHLTSQAQRRHWSSQEQEQYQWPHKAGQGAWPMSPLWCRPCLPNRLGTEMSSYLLPGPMPQQLCFLINFRLVALTQDQPPCCSSKHSRSPSSSVPPLLRDTCNPNVLQNHLSFHSQHHDLTVPAH